jgi:hypothetical protein
MTKILLLISKPRLEFTHLRVSSTVCKSVEKHVRTREQEYAHPQELAHALRAAGVPEQETGAPFLVSDTGLPTFIPVSLGVAKRLGIVRFQVNC